MVKEILAVRTKDDVPLDEDEIVAIKLNDGSVETKSEAVFSIDNGETRYFTTSNNSIALVSTVHPDLPEKPYIRTDPNETTSDNLLSLPRF